MAVKTTLILALSLAILCEVTAIATSIRQARFPVGGLFNNRALKYSRQAFETVGISRGTSSSKNYNGRIIYPSVRDSYSVALEVCKNTSNDNGIVALVDARPTDGICDTVCLLCNRYNISHLTIGWEPTETMSQDLFTFAFYPPADIISKAYATLIRDLAWDKFTIFYEDDGSFIRLQEIIGTWPHTKEPIRYRKLNPVGDNRETFKEVFKVSRMSHHVMDCDAKNILKYMREILQVENSTQYQSFILTNLDAHTVDLKQVPNLVANVSTMFMGNPDDPRWKDIGIDPGPGIQMETALAVDALNHLEKAIRKMQMDQENDGLSKQDYGIPPNLCFKDSKAEYTPWECGEKLRQALLEVETKGFTGKIKFDSEGKRTDFDMHYYKLNNESKFVQAGSWNSTTNIITKEETVPDRSMTQTSGVIRVISKRGLPYFDVKIDEDGKEIPRGYAVDLVTDIFKIINKEQGTNFTLKFWEVPDKLYGSPIEGTRKWNGIIGELMEHRADLAVCDLSITSERNAVVDFSTPFMSTGISMLFRERDPVDPDMFSFINPLSLDVWLYLATTYIIVSFILLICARMSQDDWVNPHPCNQNPESLQNIWSLYNCMWLTMGSIMTQGCDILPRGLGSRWTAGIWYFFAMIVTASYTANMSTFLSNSRRSNDITDVKQLSEQNKVSYGAVTNASTYKFFENSNDTVHQKIWQVMSTTKPTVFTSSNDEGKERVLRSKGNYAFFMESTAIKYYTERDCMLRMVGPPLDSKAYGVAMPKNFPHKGLVDRAILKLQESNRLAELQKKWWKEEDNNNKNCENVEEEDDSGSLQMKNTSGIFLVLGVGGILGLIVAIIDFLLHARKIAVKERVTWKEALASEWRASLNPRTLAKPAAPPRSAAPSSGSPSPQRERSRSRAVSVLHAASSFINFDDIY